MIKNFYIVVAFRVKKRTGGTKKGWLNESVWAKGHGILVKFSANSGRAKEGIGVSSKKCGRVEEMVGEERVKTGLPLAFVILFAMLAFVSIDCASASTIYVPDDYPTIQQAVDNATDGDTIFVRNGTYPENIRIDEKDLMIEGEDRDTTRIDGGGSGNCVRVSSADVTISAFTIKNAGGNYGVYAYRSDLSIHNATIMNCGNDAIHFNKGKSLTLRDSILEHCGGGLIYDSYAFGGATIEKNVISNNTGSGLDTDFHYAQEGKKVVTRKVRG